MKKLLLLGIIVFALSACKTTEENYRASYEAAVQHNTDKESESIDRETYNKIIEQQKSSMAVVGTDSVKLVRNYAWQFYGEDLPLKKYNVVVGAMKQKFNAKAFCDRLRSSGCESYVITDRQNNYFVVAAGFNTLEQAVIYVKDINRKIPFKLPIDEPYIYDTTKIYVKPNN